MSVQDIVFQVGAILVGLLPAVLLTIATCMDARYRKTWHWWLRLLGPIVGLVVGLISRLLLWPLLIRRFGTSYFSLIAWVSSAIGMALAVPFIIGYFGMVQASRREGEVFDLLVKQTEPTSSEDS